MAANAGSRQIARPAGLCLNTSYGVVFLGESREIAVARGCSRAAPHPDFTVLTLATASKFVLGWLIRRRRRWVQ